MTLRIGVDARTLLLDRPTGVERVAYHFVEALRRVAPPDHEYELFVDRPPDVQGADARLAELLDAPPGELVVVPRRHLRLQRLADVWIAWQMRAAMAERRLDAFVSMNTKLPLTRRGAFTTVHGLEWYFCAPDYPWVEKVKQWTWFQLCSRMSAGMITFSQHTQADIRRLRPRVRVPTRVVPEGVAPAFRELPPDERSSALLRRLGVRPPYVLSVCSLEPRKNVDGLIRAFALARREHAFPHQLVLVGRPGRASAALHDLAAESEVEEHVLFPGYVSDEDLVQLYNQARLFAYPSKYEGFGLPLIEAMACGVPVVTSDGTSTSEVAGEAAVCIDPRSDRALAAALVRVASDEALRSRLVEAGRARAREFSWDRMASDICAFLSERLDGAR